MINEAAKGEQLLIHAGATANVICVNCSADDESPVVRVYRQVHVIVMPREEVVLGREMSTAATRPAFLSKSRFSMADVLTLLNRKSREAFDSERSYLNQELKRRYQRGKLTALAYYRALARMTQEEVAAISGVPQPYISKLESGRAPLSRDKAVQLARALGISATQLLELDDAE